MFSECGQHQFQRPGLEQVVIQQEDQISALGEVRDSFDILEPADVSAIVVIANARVVEAADDFGGLLIFAVVGDDNLEILEGLRQDRTNGPLQQHGPVIRGGADGNQGRVHAVFPGSMICWSMTLAKLSPVKGLIRAPRTKSSMAARRASYSGCGMALR